MLLLVGAGTFIAVYIVIAVIRVRYPFELEWMEGGSVVHVQRILSGQPLYARPSLEFTPFIYTPFYYYVSAVPARVLGNGFLPLRLVSLAASLGSLVLIALFVRKRTRSASASFLAACLFAATFKLTGAWFDLARVDSLALFLMLAGVYVIESSTSVAMTSVAVIVLVLSFLTKQSSAFVMAGLGGAALITRRGRDRWLLPGLLGVLSVAAVWVLNRQTDGWFGYYVFNVPSRHSIEKNMLTRFWTHDLAAHLPIALLFAVFALLGAAAPTRDRGRVIRDTALFGGLLAAAYFSRIHSGGFDNVLMPAVAGVAMFFGIGMASVGTTALHRPLLTAAIFAVAAVQFLMLAYSPRYYVPTASARAEGEQLLRSINAVDGGVYLAEHPWYAVAAGKSSQAQTMAVADLIRASGSDVVRDALADEMRIAVDEERYSAFVVDAEDFLLRPADFERHYRLVDAHLSDDNFLPPTGMKRAPRLLFIRRSGAR